MNNGPVFVGYGVGIHDNVAPGLDTDFTFDTETSNIVVDPSLTLSPYTTSAESLFMTPSSGSILSPGSSVEYFGDHRASFSGCSDGVVAPHETTIHAAAAAAAASTVTTGTKARKSSSLSTESTVPPPPPPPSRAKRQRTHSEHHQHQHQEQHQEQHQQQHQQQQHQHQHQHQAPKRRPARRSASKRDDAQRSKNLERNRIAASKCRQKKKEWVHELEETKSGMELRHSTLRMEYLQLLDEVTRIKNHLMAHATCNDPNINFWIEKEALRFVEKCNDPRHVKRPSLTSNGSDSYTLPSPADSQSAHLTSPIDKAKGINLDYMPDELLAGESM